MREALGNAFIMNIVIVIVIILIGVVVSSLAYTKAYKVKNMIISAIDEHDGWNEKTREEVDQNLRAIGYKLNRNGVQTCKDLTGNDPINRCRLSALGSDYHYCVYTCDTNKGSYYRVTSYMYFDLPIVSGILEFPVSGESKTFYNMNSLK